jgi:hypothetical protein
LIDPNVKIASLRVEATAGTSVHTTFGEGNDRIGLHNRGSYRALEMDEREGLVLHTAENYKYQAKL